QAPTAPHENLARIVERYWDERPPSGKPLSPQYLADSLAVQRRFLAEVLAVPRSGLNAEAGLTYDIFKRQRELDIEGFTYPSELMPVNPFAGMPVQLPLEAAGFGEHPLGNAADYEYWGAEMDAFPAWTRQAIANMRDGMRRGYTFSRVLVERMLPELQDLGSDSSSNVFYKALRNMPPAIKEPERTQLASKLNAEIREKLLPAYRELHDFIQNDYLPRARTSIALSALPLGQSWYAYRVRRATDSALTPGEIYGIGTAEVERIRARLLLLPAGTPPPGASANAGAGVAANAGGTTGGATGAAVGSVALLNAYQELKAQVAAAIPMLFSAIPQSDFDIRAVGADGAALPMPFYQSAAPDGRTAAILYVNTASGASGSANLDTEGFLREAMPGRHFQTALQQERADLPKFRRYGTDPAFVDGWALYAASLGEELSLYHDDEAKRGELWGEMKCAVALVVDTGLQAKDWTRARAVEYLRQQLTIDAAAAEAMADRYVAQPGDALACTMGELKIQALRTRAQQVLGARFDIRGFHSEILKDGAMPLDILEAKMKLWLDAQR
ncbi:MAG: DUF885 family protein, partial [Steroidobacteraceae bacterium]